MYDASPSEEMQQKAPEEGEKARQHRLQLLGGKLQNEFEQRVNDRRQVETRWFEDLRQYNGQYDEPVLAQIKENEGSELFVNLTRTKTDAVEARITDLILPTDDRNFDIKPTPVPEVAELQSSTLQAGTTPEGHPVQVGDIATSMREVAAERCHKMRDEIDDQLAECGYNGVIRDVVHDACVLGIGILKGPINKNRVRKRWQQLKDDATGETVQVQNIEQDKRPWASRVDPWNFYPETGIVRLTDSESEFERHFVTRKQLRDLAKQPGFLPEQIRLILTSGKAPNVTVEHRVQLRAIAGDTNGRDERYELIEYTGPVEGEDLRAAGVDVKDDPLKAYPGNVWFIQGVVIKADVNASEVIEKTYHAWNWAKDDATIYGRGVPRQMRASQKMANSAVRMIYDNAGLAVGGQLIYAPGTVVPADGSSYRMTPRKTWWLMDPSVDVRNVFGLFECPLHLEWLLPLFELAMRLADEESALPLIAQGDQNRQMTKTKGGMSMLMDAAGVMLRRSVKSFDDDITVPFISAMYDWNMEFSDNEDIKGDYNVQARGSSALMEREQQLASFMHFMQFLQSNPLFAKVTKWDQVLEEGVRLLRMNRSMLLPAEEIKQVIEDMMKNPPQPPPAPQVEVAKINAEAKAQSDQVRASLEKAMHDDNFQLAMQQLATDANISMEELTSAFGIDRMKIDNENQRFNAEMAAKATYGEGI